VTGLDTNLIIRFLVWDDVDQAEAAARVIGSAVESGETLYLSSVVMCEIVWVLETAYGFSREAVSAVLDSLLRTAQMRFTDKDALWAALGDFNSGAGDFADHLIGRQGAAAGCDVTLTLDRALHGSPLFAAP
jgi:predicted nucleic-acid-binding protein